MTTKVFECRNCESNGKIVIKTEILESEIVYCPVCGADIFEENDDELD